MAILSGFAHQYGKTPAVAIGLISAIVVGTWGVFLSEKDNEHYQRIKDEITRMNQLAEKLNTIGSYIVGYTKEQIEPHTYASFDALKKACKDTLESACEVTITVQYGVKWKIREVSEMLQALTEKSRVRLLALRSHPEDRVDEGVLQAFEKLLRACQRFTHGYLFQDKPIPDHLYVHLSLQGTKATVEAHSDQLLG